MKVQSVAALVTVMAILFIMAVASEVFIDDFLEPSSMFGYLILTTLISGLTASVVVEKINAKILD
jgi:hypothetical protein